MVASKRKNFGTEVLEKLEYQIKVKSAFERLINDKWIVLDANKKKEEIHERIVESVKGKM